MSEFLHHPHLPGFVLSLLRSCAWLLILSVLFVPLEYFFAARPERFFRRRLVGDLGFYFISSFIPHLLLIVPLSIAAYVAFQFVPWWVHATVAAWPVWLRALTAFVVGDLGFYWGHRLVHLVPFLWRFHALHHSPERVYFLISARAHPIDNSVIRVFGLVPIYILGLGAPQTVQGTLIATLIMLTMTVWGFFIHANIRWRYGPLEWLIATPGFHHWHHTSSDLRDRNFASMLPVWDRIFGTHHLPATWPASYGIDENLPPSVVGQLIYPFRPPTHEPLPVEPALPGRRATG